MRDDFKPEVKEILARRVGMRCSNPNCRKLTSGPRDDPDKAVNIGVAAHMTAASPQGPRYDKNMKKEERKSIDNGIWLCQNCAKLVDNDPARYTVDMLKQWRRLSEQAARLEVEATSSAIADSKEDVDLIVFFAQCFDRPAFQDPFRQEGSMEAFDRAIEDTIAALNTGCLRSRDGTVLARAKGKAYLKNPDWRQKMDAVVDLLRAIRSRYEFAVRSGQIHVSDRTDGDAFYCIHDPEIADWMDASRAQALQLFSEICQEAGVQAPVFPRHFRQHGWGWHH